MKCYAKHTKYQPTDEEFVCPDCGAKAGDFCIDEGPGDETDCPLVHEGDYLYCHKCGYDDNGLDFVNKLLKKDKMVKCPCCNGTGYVSKEDSKKHKKRG